MTTHTDLAASVAFLALSRIPSAEDGHAAIIAAQFAAASRSADRLARARSYAGRLGSHAAEIRARLDTAAGDDTAGPLRGELVEVERQRGQAVAVLAEVEAEHARHGADLASLIGPEGEARTKLAEAHTARDLAQTGADAVKTILERATAHARAVDGRLTAARAAEARHDLDAADRLHAALREGIGAPATIEPMIRTSAALEDDARAANAAEARVASEHRIKLAALAEAERQVLAAADAVLLAEADAMAIEVQALNARAALLRGRLSAYAARTPGDHVAAPTAMAPAKLHPGGWYTRDPASIVAPPRVRQTPVIAAALSLDVATAALAPAEVAAWNAYASALARHPQAEPDFQPFAALDRTRALPDPSMTPASLSLVSSRTAA